MRDDVEEIAKAIKRMVEDNCKLIITSGGLGPTHDDMTLKGIAHAFNLRMGVNREALEIVTRQYKELHNRGIIENENVTEARMKMAILPVGSTPLDNRVGGAPGVHLHVNDVEIISLPGVPSELEWITDNQLIPLLNQYVDGIYYEEIMNLPLRDESSLAPLIDEVMKRVPDVWVKSMVKPYGEMGIRLWISTRGYDRDQVVNKVKNAVTILRELINSSLPNG